MKLTDLEESVAHSMETDTRLLPLLPELLADLSELGTSSGQIVSMLQSAGVQPGATVLDLGCGKGAVAVALAERLGLQVEGVDAFPPFLEAARTLAAERGVDSKCVFRQGDIRQLMGPDNKDSEDKEDRQFDVVLLLSVGPLSGDHQKTLRDLRGLVRKSGHIVIDDGFLAEGVEQLAGAEGYAGRAETLRRLTAWGDELVGEAVSPAEETRSLNEKNTALIRQRARQLKATNPNVAELIDEYVARQEHETRVLGTELVCATWILRRT